MGNFIKKILRINSSIHWKALRIKITKCSSCGLSILVRTRKGPLGVRCLFCGANIFSLSLAHVLKNMVPNLYEKKVYELSSEGAFFEFLKIHTKQLTFSEYFDDVSPGEYRNGIQCQDVQCLTYPDNSFDICTSTEVFEHVADDKKGFAEINRVLVKGGIFIFTVPLDLTRKTIERAEIVNNTIHHILPPEYHDDNLRGHRKVLCYRDYGVDIIERLKCMGFHSVRAVLPDKSLWWGYGRTIVVAYK